MITDWKRATEIVDQQLRAWSLYNPGCLRVRTLSAGLLTVSCWRGEMLSDEVEGFSLNVNNEGICYLLEIRLREENRGKGYGDALYKVLEEVARALGCHQIRQTPSGWCRTPEGLSSETRKAYLMRRGWVDAGLDVYKDLLDQPSSLDH